MNNPSPADLRRWRRHLANERAEAAVYRDLAQRYDGEEREILAAIAAAEERHEQHWLGLLGDQVGAPIRADLGTRTLAFLARVDAAQYRRLVENMTETAARTARFSVSLAGAGAFPAAPIGRNLWLGVYDPTDALTKLASSTRRAVERAGIRAADEKFTPHLTLARVSQPTNLSGQVAILEEWGFGPWPVNELALVESQLGQGRQGRPRYVVTDRFTLAEH